MSCRICGRGSCTESFHSLDAQERALDPQAYIDKFEALERALLGEAELALSQQRWVSVKERLPKSYETVALVDEGGFKETGFHTGERWFGHIMREAATPTHWMPLPSPPEQP